MLCIFDYSWWNDVKHVRMFRVGQCYTSMTIEGGLMLWINGMPRRSDLSLTSFPCSQVMEVLTRSSGSFMESLALSWAPAPLFG